MCIQYIFVDQPFDDYFQAQRQGMASSKLCLVIPGKGVGNDRFPDIGGKLFGKFFTDT